MIAAALSVLLLGVPVADVPPSALAVVGEQQEQQDEQPNEQQSDPDTLAPVSQPAGLQRAHALGVTAGEWSEYLLDVYGAPRSDLEALPRIDEVDLIYDHLLPLGILPAVTSDGMGDDRLPNCTEFVHRPWRSERAPHSPHAAWFYRPPPFSARPSDSWVEVTHCGGSTFEANASWYYVATGSGVWVNAGRTIAFAHNAEAVRHFLGAGYCAEGCCGDAADECDAELPETLPRAAAAAGYASIQLLHHCDLGCIDEAQATGHGCAHELMLVHGGATDASPTGRGGGDTCPNGVELRAGANASRACACVQVDYASARPPLRSDRGVCAACSGSPMLENGAVGGGAAFLAGEAPAPAARAEDGLLRLAPREHNSAVCAPAEPFEVVDLSDGSRHDPTLRYFSLVEPPSGQPLLPGQSVLLAGRGGAPNETKVLETLNLQLVPTDAFSPSTVVVADSGFASNGFVRRVGARYYAFGGEYELPAEGSIQESKEGAAGLAWYVQSDWPHRDGVHGLVSDALRNMTGGDQSWLHPAHGWHESALGNVSWGVSENGLLLDGAHDGRRDARGNSDAVMQLDGKLSVVQHADGRWLLYARANLRTHGGRYVVVARSLSASPWGPPHPAYAPFELMRIRGYDMHGPGNLYFVAVDRHPFDDRMLVALLPVNSGNTTDQSHDYGRPAGNGNGDGYSYIGLTLGCDGVHWGRPTPLVGTVGTQGRTYDHPVDGLLLEGGRAHVLIHEDVPGITLSEGATSRIVKYRLNSAALGALTAAAHAEVEGC